MFCFVVPDEGLEHARGMQPVVERRAILLYLVLVLLVCIFPVVLALLGHNRKVLLLPVHHYALALEKVVYQEISQILVKHIAGLVRPDLLLSRAPIVHLLDFVVDGLGKVLYAKRGLQNIGYLFNVEDHVAHPDRTLFDNPFVNIALLVVVIGKTGQIVNSVSFGYPILQDNPLENFVTLVFRVGAFVHQIIVVFIQVKQAHEVGVENRLQHVLAVNTAHILNFLPLEFFKDAHPSDGGMVEITRTLRHLQDLS